MRFEVHHYHHYEHSTDKGLRYALDLILATLCIIKGKLTKMDEEIDRLNDTADEELAAEQDLATEVHASLDLILSEANQLVEIRQQLADLQAQSANGTLVPNSKIVALQDKMTTSLATIKAQTASLKNALPVPPPADNPPTTDTTSGTNPAPPADNPPVIDTPIGEVPPTTDNAPGEGQPV